MLTAGARTITTTIDTRTILHGVGKVGRGTSRVIVETVGHALGERWNARDMPHQSGLAMCP